MTIFSSKLNLRTCIYIQLTSPYKRKVQKKIGKKFGLLPNSQAEMNFQDLEPRAAFEAVLMAADMS